MEHKLRDTITKIETGAFIVEPSETTMDNCYNIVLEHEDYTLGKAIEYYLYDRYFNGDKSIAFCAFKKAHPHDDYSIIQVASISSLVIFSNHFAGLTFNNSFLGQSPQPLTSSIYSWVSCSENAGTSATSFL